MNIKIYITVPFLEIGGSCSDMLDRDAFLTLTLVDSTICVGSITAELQTTHAILPVIVQSKGVRTCNTYANLQIYCV